MLKKLIAREPVRVAYTVIIILEALASALLTALEHKPANLSALALAVLTALAGEAARGRVTPVTLTEEDSAVSNLLGELDTVPAISPYVADLEHLIPPTERRKLEGIVTTTAATGVEKELGKAIGLSDEDLGRLVDMLQARGLVATPLAAQAVPATGAETVPEPGQQALATPPAQQTPPPPQQ